MKIFCSAAEEATYVKQHIKALVEAGTLLESICIVARTKKLVETYSAHLCAAGIEVYEVKRDAAEQRDRPGVRVATMHRVKGLEFEHIIVVADNCGIVPLDKALAPATTRSPSEISKRAKEHCCMSRSHVRADRR